MDKLLYVKRIIDRSIFILWRLRLCFIIRCQYTNSQFEILIFLASWNFSLTLRITKRIEHRTNDKTSFYSLINFEQCHIAINSIYFLMIHQNIRFNIIDITLLKSYIVKNPTINLASSSDISIRNNSLDKKNLI